MAWTRRQFLSRATVLAAGLTAGCTSRVGGAPRSDPTAPRAERAEPLGLAEVTIGVLAYQPYTIEDGNDVSGPVPDVARKVLTELGAEEVTFQVLREEQLAIAAIAAGQVDMIGGLAVRADLCRNLTFSRPDYVSGTAFAVLAGNPKGLRGYADVIAKNARIAVMTGLPEDGDAVAAGVPDGSIVRDLDLFGLIDQVRDGRVDCFAFDDISLRDMVKTKGPGLEVTDPFMPANRPPLVGAYAFPTGSELAEPFDEALRELHESGEWQRMVEPFGLGEHNAPPADLTVEKACGA
jgi:polar amino acid transport system substrate-binding protein